MEIEEDRVSPAPSLEETFYILSKKNTMYRVKLSEKGLCLQKECNGTVKTETIDVEDIIGCRCMRSKRFDQKCIWHPNHKKTKKFVEESTANDWDETDISAYLYIYAYVIKNKSKSKSKRKRERTVITLRFRSYDKYEENMKEAQKWRVTIRYFMHNIGKCSLPSCYFKPTNIKIENKLLFVVNPKSGTGKGKELFQRKVVPILTEADVNFDLHVTKYRNDARNLVRTQNLWQYMGGIVAVGGDGILYEIFNGLMERPDWEILFNELKFGVLPAGSGNGLAASIAYMDNEPYIANPILISTLNIVKGNSCPLDLVRVETNDQVVFSFLSIGWGFISDVDIQSEWMRVIGSPRFTIYSLGKLICLKSYKGTVSYLPVSESEVRKTEKEDQEEEIDAKSIQSEDGRRGSFYSVGSYKSTFLSAVGSSYESLTEDNVKMFGPPSMIPPLNQSLPSDWVIMKGEFILVHAAYPSHIGEDCLFAPSAKLNDGCMWLCIIKNGISRYHLLQFLLGLPSGAHINIPHVTYVAVKAFRIEPETLDSHLTVDGERMPFGPLQAEIMPAMANVFSSISF